MMHPEFIPTEMITPGDMITFWEWFGIFVGVATPDEISDVSLALAQDPNGLTPVLKIDLKYKGERKYASLAFSDSVMFATGTPEDEQQFRVDHIEFVKLLIDSELKILPRLRHPYFSYDDKLRVVQHVFQTE